MRCRWAIKFGTTLTTRCGLPDGVHDQHRGKGLAEFPSQEIVWLDGDRRSFLTDRADEHAWETTFALPEPQTDGTVVWHGADGKIVEDWHGPDNRPN
jgi:hypothetical protein